MEGELITRRELQARWSYSELTGRFAQAYVSHHTSATDRALISRIQGGASFKDLNASQTESLADWFQTGFRRDYANALRSWYDKFKCERWTQERLLQVGCLPILDPSKQGGSVRLLAYLVSSGVDCAIGQPHPEDPRVHADQVLFDQAFIQKEPLVVGHLDGGQEVLWEGYFRAALFCRTIDRSQTVL